MRTIAIDPGYERLGVAVVEKLPRNTTAPRIPSLEKGGREKLLYSSCIQTARTLAHEKRLLAIANAVAEIIAEWKPQALAIETLFLFTNQKTAMAVAEARGAVLVEAARAGLAVHEYTPLQIKMAVTGYGKSDKRQVAEMVKKLIAIPDKTTLLSKKIVLPLIRESKSLASKTRYSLLKREDTTHLPKTAGLPLVRENTSTRLDDEYDAIAVGLTHLASYKWNR